MAFLATSHFVLPQRSALTYPRKMSTFYTLDAPSVPKALQATPSMFPAGGITALAETRNAVWIGTANGLIRYAADTAAQEKIQYLAGRRYLPDDHVLAIVADGESGVWVRTVSGVAYVDYRPVTLAKKARMFESMQAQRHFRHGLVSEAILEHAGDLSQSHTLPSDNDGLWTAMYAAAECFRYRVEQSAASLERAHAALNAILYLSQVTGIPGYPARSFVESEERYGEGSDWHDSPDGLCRWQGDTSSDEIVGHFFLYSIAYDLLPDRTSKQRIADTVRAIADNILDHGYNLVGESGQPTTWGKWSTAYFQSAKGRPDAPLNSLELLSILKTAAHVTGDTRFAVEYHRAALDLGYAALSTRYLELRDVINYSDEELFMLAVYPLMSYEKDPVLLAFYQKALDQWWQNEQRENNPLWSFLYQRCTRGEHIQLNSAISRLGRLPFNRIQWTVANSTRDDARLDGGTDRFQCRQTTVLLPPDELPIRRWNGNPFCVDERNDGRIEEENTTYLLPYWMGRYFHFVQ